MLKHDPKLKYWDLSIHEVIDDLPEKIRGIDIFFAVLNALEGWTVILECNH